MAAVTTGRPVVPGEGGGAPGEGARTQLAAVGPQNAYVHGRSATLWARTVRRHVPFDVRTVEVPVPWTPGARSAVDLPRAGDVLADVTLELRLPAVPGSAESWPPRVGLRLLRRVRLLAGDAELTNLERLWYDVAERLGGDDARTLVATGPLPMARAHVIYVPLLLFGSGRGAARPCLPLQHLWAAPPRLDIEFEALAVAAPNVRIPAGWAPVATALADVASVQDYAPPCGFQAFDQVVDCDAVSQAVDGDGDATDLGVLRVDLSKLAMGVKLLAWVAYEENDTMFQYLDVITHARLSFDNQERAAERPSRHFELVQTWGGMRCRPGPPAAYAFALAPMARLPTGAADFSGLRAAFLEVRLAPGTPRVKVKVFAVCTNAVEFASGSARVRYV